MKIIAESLRKEYYPLTHKNRNDLEEILQIRIEAVDLGLNVLYNRIHIELFFHDAEKVPDAITVYCFKYDNTNEDSHIISHFSFTVQNPQTTGSTEKNQRLNFDIESNIESENFNFILKRQDYLINKIGFLFENADDKVIYDVKVIMKE